MSDIKFENYVRSTMKDAINIVANSVKTTLGPKGRNVVIFEQGIPHITKDGVTVAKAIYSSDPHLNTCIQMIKEAAIKTADNVGDGTTTATVLAQAIINQGISNVTAGSNPIELKKGIDKAVKFIVSKLQSISIPVTNDDQIKQIATISANNDEIIGSLISDAFKEIGTKGVITVDESPNTETYIKSVKGMSFGRGYVSPAFINDQTTSSIVYEDPYFLITNKKLNTISELTRVIEIIRQQNRPLIIIADDFDDNILMSLVANYSRGIIKIACVKTPGFGNRKNDILQDLAILTGSTFINKDVAKNNLDDFTILGSSSKVVITSDNTTIISGNGDSEQINNRVIELETLIANSKNSIDIEKYQERISNLVAGIAIFYVGAVTEIEMKEKKDRIDDAVAATKAAIEEGIVPGGGIAYIKVLKDLKDLKGDSFDENLGISIMYKSLTQPLIQNINNSGETGELVVSNLVNHHSTNNCNKGYNVKTGEYSDDMITSGIIDPTKVSRIALENAASIASMMLTTECIIVND